MIDVPTFRPHPLVRGGHLQTIVASYLPQPAAMISTLHHVQLPDGDAIALHDDGDADALAANNGHTAGAASQAVAILIHGLGGTNQSGYMLRASAKLRARGVRVFRMDLRGCGAGLGLARHPLHAGRSEDAGAALEYVHRLFPAANIHVVGFSMGANIALKLAGELGAKAPPHLASVVAASPPIDLAMCTRYLHRGLSRIYDRRFVVGLVKHIRRRLAAVPEALSRPLVPHPRRLIEFDGLFTAPLSGFSDVHDYYTRASSCTVLAKIAVPTLIITAASDPIVPVASFEQASYSATTHVVIAPCGGHLGFLARRGLDPDIRWLDWRIVDWVTCQAAQRGTSPVAHEADQRPVEDRVAAVGDMRGAVG